MEGILKQQCITDDGLYTWQKKFFRLNDTTKTLDIFSVQEQERGIEPMISIPIHSMKLAKEWSFSSALGGYGFDLIWYSGKIWSFLVEKEQDCRAWVDTLNHLLNSVHHPKASNEVTKEDLEIKQKATKEILQTISAHKEFLSSLNSNSSFLQEMTSGNTSEMTKTESFPAVATSQENIDLYPHTLDQLQQTQVVSDINKSQEKLKPRNNRYSEDDYLLASTTKMATSLGQRPPLPHHHPTVTFDQTLQNLSSIPKAGSNADSESEHSSAGGSDNSNHRHQISTIPFTPIQGLEKSARTAVNGLQSPQSPKSPVRSPTGTTQNYRTSNDSHSSRGGNINNKSPNRSPNRAKRGSLDSPTKRSTDNSQKQESPKRNHSPLSPPRLPTFESDPSRTLPPTYSNYNSKGSNFRQTYNSLDHTKSNSTSINPSSQSSTKHSHLSLLPPPPPPPPPSKEYLQNMKDIFAQTKNSLLLTEEELRDLQVNNDTIAHHLRIKQMEQLLTDKETAFLNLQKQFHDYQELYQRKVYDLQQEVLVLKRQEEEIEKKVKEEMATKVLKASNEHVLFYESQTKSLKNQHQRELQCLQDEIQDIRQKHKLELDKEQSKRKTITIEWETIRSQYEQLNENYQQLMSDTKQLQLLLKQRQTSQQTETETVIRQLRDEIQDLQQEKLQLHQSYQQQLLKQQQEKDQSYQQALEQMRKQQEELIKQETKQSYLQQVQQLQQQYQENLLQMKNEEQQRVMIEIERQQQLYTDKERQLSQQYYQSEQLHTQRIQQYEQTIQSLTNKIDSLQEYHSSCTLQSEQKLQEQGILLQRVKTELQQQILTTNQLQLQSQHLQESYQQQQIQERIYRDQLVEALQQKKILELEKQELSYQLMMTRQEAQEKINQMKELLQSMTNQEQTVRIQREEIVMLEGELQRLQQENNYLQQEVLKYERIIYGVSQQKNLYSAASLLSPPENSCPVLQAEIEPKYSLLSSKSSPSLSNTQQVPASTTKQTLRPSINTNTSHTSPTVGSKMKTRISENSSKRMAGKASTGTTGGTSNSQMTSSESELQETRKAYPFLKSRKCEYCLRYNASSATTSKTPHLSSSLRKNKSNDSDPNRSGFVCQYCHQENRFR